MAVLLHEEHGPPDGPPVVLLHGFPLHRAMWRPVAQRLASEGLRVLLPDLRGHGASPPGEGAATMDAMADDVAAWLDGLGLRRCILGGFSMGGYVALAFAERHAHRLDGLVLACTRSGADPAGARRGRMDVAARVRRHGMEVLAETMLPKLLSPRARLDDALREAVLDQMRTNPAEGAAAALEGMAVRLDRTSTLAAFQGPVLVLAAAEDPIIPLEEARAMASAAPRAHLVVVEGPAHLVPMESPERTGDAMAAWATAKAAML